MNEHDYVGRQVGQYELRQRLGEGGMGAVYRAIDTILDRSVAIKIMHPHVARQEEFRHRFLREARAIAALDHPNIIQVYAFHSEGNETFLVMEFVSTGSLRHYIEEIKAKNQTLSLAEAMTLVRQIGAGLFYAHQKGMVHRDIKPGNILLKPDTNSTTNEQSFRALISDFGLVKLSENTTFQTEGISTMGTLPYMAPEQVAGMSNLDHRADLYALGIMLFELCVGQLPFVPKNLMQAVSMHTHTSPPLPHTLNPAIPQPLENVILKSIAKDPAQRFQSGQEFAQTLLQLEQFLQADLTLISKNHQNEATLVGSLHRHQAILPQLPSELSQFSSKRDTLTIHRGPGETVNVELSAESYILGSNQQSDIYLPSPLIAPQHARLDRLTPGEWTITDLGSDTKTYLDGVSLLSHVPEPWLSNHIVSLGEYRLGLHLAQPEQRHARPRSVFPSSEVTPTLLSERDTYQVSMVPSTLTAELGSMQALTIRVKNRSTTVRHVRVRLEGVPNDWIVYIRERAKLMPDDETDLQIQLHIPIKASVPATAYPLSVVMVDEDKGSMHRFEVGLFNLKARYGLEVDIHPQRMRRSGSMKVHLTNTSNAPIGLSVSPRDAEGGVIFDPPDYQTTLPANSSDTFQFGIWPRKTNWLGSTRQYPIEIRIQSPALPQQQRLNAELIDPPRFPIWLLSMLVMLCIVLAVVAVLFAVNRSNEPNEQVAAVSDTPTPTETDFPTDTPTSTATPSLTPSPSETIVAPTLAPSFTPSSVLPIDSRGTIDAIANQEATRLAQGPTQPATATVLPTHSSTPATELRITITDVQKIDYLEGNPLLEVTYNALARGYAGQEFQAGIVFYWADTDEPLLVQGVPSAYDTPSGQLARATTLDSTQNQMEWKNETLTVPYAYFPLIESPSEFYIQAYIQNEDRSATQWSNEFKFSHVTPDKYISVTVTDREMLDDVIVFHTRVLVHGYQGQEATVALFFYWDDETPIVNETLNTSNRVQGTHQMVMTQKLNPTNPTSVWNDLTFTWPYTYFPTSAQSGKTGSVSGFVSAQIKISTASTWQFVGNRSYFSLAYD